MRRGADGDATLPRFAYGRLAAPLQPVVSHRFSSFCSSRYFAGLRARVFVVTPKIDAPVFFFRYGRRDDSTTRVLARLIQPRRLCS